ncbi:hypothetical protein ACVGXX_00230, partial [Enterobacter intestinihominis]
YARRIRARWMIYRRGIEGFPAPKPQAIRERGLVGGVFCSTPRRGEGRCLWFVYKRHLIWIAVLALTQGVPPAGSFNLKTQYFLKPDFRVVKEKTFSY